MHYHESPLERLVRGVYRRVLRPSPANHLSRQRIKLLWFVWGYAPLLRLPLPWGQRLTLLWTCLRVDWHVKHAHLVSEVVALCLTLAARRAAPGEVVVEAGCWQGGLSAKLSVLCRMLGYQLYVYDSFEGVETLLDHQDEASDFFGQYVGHEDRVRHHIDTYGEWGVCRLIKGWFSETLAQPVPAPVVLGYIDCDLVQGTREAFRGIIPALTPDGVMFSEDYHLVAVREYLRNPRSVADYGKGPLRVTPLGPKLARLEFVKVPA